MPTSGRRGGEGATLPLLRRAAPAWAAVMLAAGTVTAGAVADTSTPPSASHGRAVPSAGTYAWPVEGPVIRRFDPPGSPYGAGHRGIDIAVPLGTGVRAAEEGVVAFAGPVAGGLYVSVDHPDGIRTTYSWLSEVLVRAGDPIERGARLGLSGPGHPGVEPPHLHLGARLGDVYLDPMLLLERGSLVGLVRLAPLDERWKERAVPAPP